MKNTIRHFEVIRSNKRERTITFKSIFDDGTSSTYKTTGMDKESWNYYTSDATDGDWESFVKNGDYYILH